MSSSGHQFQADDGQPYIAYCPGAANSIYYLLACLADTGFLGCSTDQNACHDGGYAADYSNFTLSAYSSQGPQSFHSNIQSQRCDTGSEWYSCVEDDLDVTNFIGCCTANPCHNGCPESSYAPSYLSPDPAAAKFFYPLNASSMSFSIPSTSTSSTASASSGSTLLLSSSLVSINPASAMTSPSMSSYTSSTTSPQVLQTASSPGATVVVGSVVGGIAGLMSLLILVAYHVRRTAKSRRHHLENLQASSSAQGVPEEGEEEGKTDNEIAGNPIAEAPPSSAKLQEPVESIVPPSPVPASASEHAVSASIYTAYSRPFSELEASLINPPPPAPAAAPTPHQPATSISTATSSGPLVPANLAYSPPPSRESVRRSISPHPLHPYPVLGGYSDGVGVAR